MIRLQPTQLGLARCCDEKMRSFVVMKGWFRFFWTATIITFPIDH